MRKQPDGERHIKRTYPGHGELGVRIETAKARAAARALAGVPGLRTPEVLASDPAAGTIAFAFIPGLRSLTPFRPAACFRRTGLALGTLHVRLDLPPDLRLIRRSDAGKDGLAPVHGDFGVSNVKTRGREITILDFGLRPWVEEPFTLASPALDLASFLASWIYDSWTDIVLPRRKIRLFLQAYFEAVGRESEIGRRARADLGREMRAQMDYIRREIGKRSAPKRAFLRAKTAVFLGLCRRMIHEHGS
jgi:tRNA A-37 threonylcarbamoyl transferase component Bud32